MTKKQLTISLCWTKTHLSNSCTWQYQWERTVPYANHSTAQLIENWNNSQVSYRIHISNSQTQHILMSQNYSFVAERNNTLLKVIITLKTLWWSWPNEKVGYHFWQVILLFWLQQKVVSYTKYKIKKNLWIFLSEALAALEKWQTTPDWKQLMQNIRTEYVQCHVKSISYKKLLIDSLVFCICGAQARNLGGAKGRSPSWIIFMPPWINVLDIF